MAFAVILISVLQICYAHVSVPVSMFQGQENSSKSQEETITQLIKQLDDDDPQPRDKAQEELIKIGKPALNALGKAAQSSSQEVQSRAKKAIRRIKINTQLWEFDPLKKAKKESPETISFSGRKYELKSVTELPDEEVRQVLQGVRVFKAEYVTGVYQYPHYIIVDIEGETEVLNKGMPSEIHKMFFKDEIIVKDEKGALKVARVWKLLSCFEDKKFDYKITSKEGFKIKGKATHWYSKSGPWKEAIMAVFNDKGVLKELERKVIYTDEEDQEEDGK